MWILVADAGLLLRRILCFHFSIFLKFRVPFCPLTILAEFAEEVVLHLHQRKCRPPVEATPKATYLQRVVKGATPWRSVRLQAEFPFVKVWGVRRTKQMAELLFNIEYHKAYYDVFPLKLY